MSVKYIFLDRDGVINADAAGVTKHGYITRWEDFYFLPGVLESFKKAAEAGYKCVVISNQQGVGKGYHSEAELFELTEKMKRAIKAAGGAVAGVFYCVHLDADECGCRKPEAGLFHQAQEGLNIKDMRGKYYIGDTERDVQAGQKAGLKTILVLSGKTDIRDIEEWEWRPDHVCKDLLSAVEFVIKGEL
ncbi:MAG: HAD-IIIA family hydrolase [Candidatus Omnitrophica bacterium]|nr:HAD-IIIA family hydrolase [Candidatus Omnitrophota bacterium]MBU1128553.1 HAD-IIIA family hydrolase [Candidatus Omnitrophota bacterium]MBU1656576.1 HAD-IIIA family hydrolase [Candidatus Omnitrophota bacterium]MBU1851736.1 HAD-IIIA family hydrolase [Candidatus Omnitrophota bacterium]